MNELKAVKKELKKDKRAAARQEKQAMDELKKQVEMENSERKKLLAQFP